MLPRKLLGLQNNILKMKKRGIQSKEFLVLEKIIPAFRVISSWYLWRLGMQKPCVTSPWRFPPDNITSFKGRSNLAKHNHHKFSPHMQPLTVSFITYADRHYASLFARCCSLGSACRTPEVHKLSPRPPESGPSPSTMASTNSEVTELALWYHSILHSNSLWGHK